MEIPPLDSFRFAYLAGLQMLLRVFYEIASSFCSHLSGVRHTNVGCNMWKILNDIGERSVIIHTHRSSLMRNKDEY